MTVKEKIIQHVQSLPESLQVEVLDFIEYLESKVEISTMGEEERDWSKLSLYSASRGMEMENEQLPYTISDLKERYQ